MYLFSDLWIRLTTYPIIILVWNNEWYNVKLLAIMIVIINVITVAATWLEISPEPLLAINSAGWWFSLHSVFRRSIPSPFVSLANDNNSEPDANAAVSLLGHIQIIWTVITVSGWYKNHMVGGQRFSTQTYL